ncbi:peptide deformylase [filamentous cyanobacterium CCP5]|nr:peptide deformylase [filamentous cyanobacterium CCP5]
MSLIQASQRSPEQRPVLQLGDPGLRRIAQPVGAVADAWVQRLIDDLLVTLQANNGVGIAAPQVGMPCRLLVVASRPNLRYPTAPQMEPEVMINPRLVAHGDRLERGWEGCLSVPGLRAQIPRYREIEVEYSDRQGQIQRRVWTGFVARIFQHEYDHLEGQVLLDRLETPADLISEAEYFARILEG